MVAIWVLSLALVTRPPSFPWVLRVNVPVLKKGRAVGWPLVKMFLRTSHLRVCLLPKMLLPASVGSPAPEDVVQPIPRTGIPSTHPEGFC